MKRIFVTDFSLNNTEGQISFRDKTNIAKTLDSVGVDAIELAPLKNVKEDTVVNRTIAGMVKNCTVKISCGMTAQSIEEAFNSINCANDPCLQISIPVSTVQMEYLYHVKAPQMQEKVVELVKTAKEKCDKVEFKCMDATRADREFLKSVCTIAAENGAVAVTLCDDAGIMMPEEFAEMVADVKAACNIAVYVCPSNAISMAAACAVAAIKSGADGVVTSVSGELMSADVFSDIIRTRGADMGVECRLNVAGIHREIDSIKSQMAGKSGSVTVVADSSYTNVSLTADSTLTEVSEAVRALGYELSHEDSGKVFEEFKRVSAKKSKIGIKEIDAIVAAAAMQVPSTYHVESYVINSGNIINATANVILTRDCEKLCGISVGDGPINAAFLAIEQVIGHHYELDDFQIQSVTEGHEAMGSALVKLRDGDKLYSGSGVSTDIIGASIRAYVNALNKIVYNAK